MGLLDGELVINPTLEETEHSSDLDLIVVGTKDGLTMVEAGANRVPENDASSRRSRSRTARS